MSLACVVDMDLMSSLVESHILTPPSYSSIQCDASGVEAQRSSERNRHEEEGERVLCGSLRFWKHKLMGGILSHLGQGGC